MGKAEMILFAAMIGGAAVGFMLCFALLDRGSR